MLSHELKEKEEQARMLFHTVNVLFFSEKVGGSQEINVYDELHYDASYTS